MNDVLMRTRAYENGVHLVFVHPKRCLIIDPDGTIIAQDSDAGDEIVKSKITLRGSGSHGPIRRRRPEIYGELLLTQEAEVADDPPKMTCEGSAQLS